MIRSDVDLFSPNFVQLLDDILCLNYLTYKYNGTCMTRGLRIYSNGI